MVRCQIGRQTFIEDALDLYVLWIEAILIFCAQLRRHQVCVDRRCSLSSRGTLAGDL